MCKVLNTNPHTKSIPIPRALHSTTSPAYIIASYLPACQIRPNLPGVRTDIETADSRPLPTEILSRSCPHHPAIPPATPSPGSSSQNSHLYHPRPSLTAHTPHIPCSLERALRAGEIDRALFMPRSTYKWVSNNSGYRTRNLLNQGCFICHILLESICIWVPWGR